MFNLFKQILNKKSVLHTIKTLKKCMLNKLLNIVLHPFFGLKIHWVTEITHVEYLHYFLDEPRFGNYTLWHCKHFLKKIRTHVIRQN